MRLHWKIVRREALSPAGIAAMWRVFERYYDGVDRERFEHDLSEKDFVIHLLDEDERIVGFSTLQVLHENIDGRKAVALYTGDTILERQYWGQTALQSAFAVFLAGLKARYPHLPVYWFLISKGYKTYLLMARNFVNFWPRHDAELPIFEKKLLAVLATKKFGQLFDTERGLLLMQGGDGHLKQGVAPIDEAALRAPDVRYFAERNPNHSRGDELCCLAKVDLDFALFFSTRHLRKLAYASLDRTRSFGGLLSWRVRTRQS